jgi:hypothetical protein
MRRASSGGERFEALWTRFKIDANNKVRQRGAVTAVKTVNRAVFDGSVKPSKRSSGDVLAAGIAV